MAELPKSQRSGNARTGRRRRSSAFWILGVVFTAIVLGWFFESQATTTIIFVRHAETEAPPSEASDPPLSARGRLRAELLAAFLESVDVVASVDAIYVSDDRRTRETAQPLASRLGVRVAVEDPYRVEAFMQSVLRDHKGDIVLIVTQGDALAPLIAELHGSKHVVVAPDEHDSVYVLSIPWFGKVKTLHFRYGIGVDFADFDRYTEMNGGPRSQVP